MPWLTIPDGNVAVVNTGSGGLSHIGGVFTASDAYASPGSDIFDPPAQNYFAVTLPAGYAYTGAIRMVITSSTGDSIYEAVCFQERDGSGGANVIPPGTYTYDYAGLLFPSTVVYAAAGANDGAGWTGEYVFTLEFEYTEAPPAEFWTGFRGCEETL